MGLMSRVLETTGSTSSEGLLRRATELRRKVQETVQSVQTATAPRKPAAKITAVSEKKKLSTRFFQIGRLTLSVQ